VLLLLLLPAAAAAAGRYGRIAASDKEIEEVADAACIHEPITTRFPKVGAAPDSAFNFVHQSHRT
jgi:hypothetical protein